MGNDQRLISAIKRIVAPIQRRAFLSIARGVLKVINDDPKLQEVQVSLLRGEVKDKVERWTHYGYRSRPLPGCESILVFVGGNRDHGAVVADFDRRYRGPDLDGGDVALFTDLDALEDAEEELHRIVLKRGREIHYLVSDDCRIVQTPESITLHKANSTVVLTDEQIQATVEVDDERSQATLTPQDITAEVTDGTSTTQVEMKPARINATAPDRIHFDTPLLFVTGDIVAGTAEQVSMLDHVHTGVQPGGGLSDEPLYGDGSNS